MSAGLATNEAGVNSLDEIVVRADAALYLAKADGRNLVRLAQEHFLTASTAVRRVLHQRVG